MSQERLSVTGERAHQISRRIIRTVSNNRIVSTGGLVVAFLFGWELLVLALSISQRILPQPLDIGRTIVNNWELYAFATVETLEGALLGFGAGGTIGILMALVLHRSRLLHRMLMPVLVIVFVIPKIVLAPLFVLWVGAGLGYYTLVPLLLVFFPVLENSLTGFESTPDGMTDLSNLYGAGGWFTFRHFLFPHALPDILSGLKIGVTQAMVGIVIAEFVAPEQGLGELMILGLERGDSLIVWGSIVLIGIFGILFYKLVELFETRFVFWHNRVADR